VTGRGGHIIGVDDPHANRKEAESQVERNNVWDYFISTLYTRKEKNGGMVVIMQRWHEDDLVGRLRRLKDPNSEDYREGFPPVKFINLPAIAETNDVMGRNEGDALWPAFKDENELDTDKIAMGDYFFNSQYQQRPTAPEGNIFKRHWFRVVPSFPLDYKIQYWDTADKEGEDNDYWSCCTMGVGKFGILTLDMYRKKMSAEEGMEEIKRRYDMFSTEDEPVAVVWVEAKSSGRSCVSVLQAGDDAVPVAEHTPKGDKVQRASTITAHCSNRRIVMLHHSQWIRDFLDEITSFPFGVYDDQVDAFVGAASKIIHGGYLQTATRVRQEEKRTGSDRLGTDYRREKFKRTRKSRLIKPPSHA
jgi:predicted phage terminase large subunit-like protein